MLRAHARAYPLMLPQDAVKLLYQGEFGGGHMIADPGAALKRLRAEYAAVKQTRGGVFLEDIGFGFARANLSAMDENAVTPETLCAWFCQSAQQTHGRQDSFLQKLEAARMLARAGAFRFDASALAAYLRAYADAGYPAVSHSEAYRFSYAPAYRVVLLSAVQK